MIMEELWFKGTKGEYNPNDPENDVVEPYSSWNQDLVGSMPSGKQYKALLSDPSKIWCYMGQARLGAAYNPSMDCSK